VRGRELSAVSDQRAQARGNSEIVRRRTISEATFRRFAEGKGRVPGSRWVIRSEQRYYFGSAETARAHCQLKHN
jgi:hypothetical protein